MFQSRADCVLQGLGKEKIRQMMCAPFAFLLYAKKGRRDAEIFMTLFCEKCIPAGNVNGEQYILIPLKNQRH